MAINTTKRDNPILKQIESKEGITRADELEYLSDIISQLQKIALKLDEKTLAYVLELAMVEAKLLYDAEIYQLRIIEASENNL